MNLLGGKSGQWSICLGWIVHIMPKNSWVFNALWASTLPYSAVPNISSECSSDASGFHRSNFTLVDEFMICDVHMDAHEFRTLCLLSAQVWDEAENSQTSCSASGQNGFSGIKLETVTGVNNTTRRHIIWQHKIAIANKLLCVCVSVWMWVFFVCFVLFFCGIFAQGRKHLQFSGDLKYSL